ncbi:MAG: hypothetical protein HYX75_15140 [Acidobacteria bacterium]|nr:hypothetical protein [Acidobacteriota bacterium]
MGCVLVLLALLGASCVEGVGAELFPSSAASVIGEPLRVSRVEVVTVNPDVLTEQGPTRIGLRIFGVERVAERTKMERRSRTNWSWFGHLEGDSSSSVILVNWDGDLYGTISGSAGRFAVLPGWEAGTCRLLEPVVSPGPQCAAIEFGDILPAEYTAIGPEPITPAAPDVVTVNVLVMYTQGAEDRATQLGVTIPAVIQVQVDSTNQAYAQSQVSHRIAHTLAKVSYADSGSLYTDLTRMVVYGDGYFDDLLVQKQAVAADIPVLVVGLSSDAGGLGSLMTVVSEAFAQDAAAVLNTDNVAFAWAFSFAHEIGHVMGVRHNWEDDPQTTPYIYAHGYGKQEADFRDIMSYPNACPSGCVARNYFSNPNLNFNGYPMGIAEGAGPQPADAVRALNNTAPTVATFRNYLATCTYALNAYSRSVSSAAGSGSYGVTTTDGCRWSVNTSDSWITITSAPSAYGTSVVTYTYGEHGSQSSRAGTITVTPVDGSSGTISYILTQSPAGACTVSTNPTGSVFFATAGGIGSFAINVNSQGCAWTVSNGLPWVTITSATSGTGNATVTYTVAPNANSMRSGYIQVNAGGFQAQYAVAQQGRSCPVVLTPGSASYASGGGSGSFGITETSGCGWTATSYDLWLTITGGASGTVSYSVASTSSTTGRTGSIVVDTGAGNQTFIAMQNGVGQTCAYAVTPFSETWDDDGGSTSVSITTTTGCAWNSVSNDAWISFSAGSGSGSGSVTMSVDANLAPAARTGSVAIAGTTYAIAQEAYDSGGGGGGTTPVINTISSKKAKPKTSAKLVGTNFSATKTQNTVYFGKYTATIKSAGTSQLKVTIPSQCKSGKTYQVSVNTNDVRSNTIPFQVK